MSRRWLSLVIGLSLGIAGLWLVVPSMAYAGAEQKGRAIVPTHIGADPDGDGLSYLWFHYPEAGPWKTPIKTDLAGGRRQCFYQSSSSRKAGKAHFIVKVTDRKNPPLTPYPRVIVTVLPK